MAAFVEEYKKGIKREVIGALRKVFGSTYPDQELAGKVQIIQEYPLKEVNYPMIIVRYSPQIIENMGLGHFDMVQDDEGIPQKILHWRFEGTVSLTVYALTPGTRDDIIVGLMNLFAFGSEIPGFTGFADELRDYDYSAIQILDQSLQESGDQVVSVPWNDDEEPVFTDSITFTIFGEMFSQLATGDLIEVSQVTLYPYRPDQPRPIGSTATLGTPGTPEFKDDATVPWFPIDSDG